MQKEPLIKRNVNVNRRRTSILLNHVIWTVIDRLLEEEQVSLSFLCYELEKRKDNFSFAQALQMLAAIYFRQMALQRLDDDPPDTSASSAEHTQMYLADNPRSSEQHADSANRLVVSLSHFSKAVAYANGHVQHPESDP